MSSRTRSRRPASIGSNQSSRRWTAVPASDCRATDFVLLLLMAWGPLALTQKGLSEAGQCRLITGYGGGVVLSEHRLNALEDQRPADDAGRGHRCGAQKPAAPRQSGAR